MNYSYIRNSKRPLWVQYNPYYECNLKCSWCYNQKVWGSQDMMSQEVLEKSVRMISKAIKTHKLDGLCVSLLGGEPTLYPDLMLSIVEETSRIEGCWKAFWLFTNGMALTEELAKRFNEAGIFIVVAVNESPLSLIEDRLELVRKSQSVLRVSVTLSKYNLQRLVDIAESSLKHNYFLRLFVEHKGYQQFGYFKEYLKNVTEAFKVLEQSKGPRRRFNLLYEHFLPFWNEVKSPYLPGSRFFSIDPDGSLWGYNGTRDIGKFGSVESDDFLSNLKTAVSYDLVGRWSAKDIGECDGCEVRNICQGGYPVPKYHVYKSWNRKSPFCELYKIMIPKFKDLYYKIPEG